MNNDWKISLTDIERTLTELPEQLYHSDLAIAQAERTLAEYEESLEIATINVSLNCTFEEKDTAPTKELKRKRAMAQDPEVKSAKSKVIVTKAEIEKLQAQNKMLSRQFAGVCHLSELRAAQMNLMSKGATK